MKWRPSTTFSLILVFALLAVFALWLSFRVANTAMLAMVDQRELDKVQTVGRMVSGTLDGQSRQVSQAAQLTAGRAELGAALLGRPDYKAIRAVVEDARGISGLDLLEVVNAEERVLYRSSDPARYGDTSTNWGVYEALQGSGLLASTEKEGMVVLYALQPIRASGRVVGALSVGVPLDDPLFIRIGQEVGAALGPQQVVEAAQASGIDLIAPQLGTAHGVYHGRPKLLPERAREFRALSDKPIVLHGGTGLTTQEFQAFIEAGVSKINISTELKMTYMKSALASLRRCEQTQEWDTPTLFNEIGGAVETMAVGFFEIFGSAGRA